MDEPRCQSCGHRHGAHRPACCHRLVGGDWTLADGFTKDECCECAAYVGVEPRRLNECPHEFVSTDPHTCVLCGRTVKKVKEKER